MVAKGSKVDNGPPGWKALLAAASDANTLDERTALVQPVIAQVQAVLDEHPSQAPGSQKLFTALAVSPLSTSIAGLDPESPLSYRQLLAVHDVLVGSDRRLAAVLDEHQFLSSLVRLHQKVGDMSKHLSQAVVLVLCTITLLAGTAAGNLETVASRPEVAELLVSQLTFLSLNPAVLLSPAGLGTAQRCIQTCWELTRAASAHCRAFRELLQRIDMAGRLMLIAAVATGRDGGTLAAAESLPEGEAASAAGAAAAVAWMAALEDLRTSGTAPAAATVSEATSATSSEGASDLYEERLALAAQAISFVANLAGLGIRGIELSAAGLAPQRAWLLRPGTMTALREPLDGMVDGLAELRRRIEAEGPEAPVAVPPRSEGKYADLAPGRVPLRRLLDQLEGAVRNLLFLLGLPTIVMGKNEEDVVEACGFVIRHNFSMFTDGYVDTMRALRNAVSEPPGPTGSRTGPGGFTAPYPGDYGLFFRAFAGHVETVAPAIGVQLEDWGVRFTGEQAERDLPVMTVGEGVDARIAHSWLKGQVQDIINWGHAMMNLVRMADQAKLPPPQPPRRPPQSLQEGPQELKKPPAVEAAACGEAGSGGAATAPGAGAGATATGQCGACGATPPAGGPLFQLCSKCRGVRYCSKACQVGDWPQHKGVCKAPAAAAPATVAPAAVAPAAAAAAEPEEPAAATPAPASVAVVPEPPAAGKEPGSGGSDQDTA